MKCVCLLVLVAIAGAGLVGLVGCSGREPPIQSYSVPATPLRFDAPVTDQAPHFEVPQGWQAGRAGGMRKAAFEVVEDDLRIEITVIDLGPAAGDLLANVNIWRDQLGLGPTSQEQLEAASEVITAADHSARYIEIENSETSSAPRAIYGVMVPESGAIDGKIWFIKLAGDAQLARDQRDNFRQFVQSMQFLPD